MKRHNVHVTAFPEEEKGPETVFKAIKAEKFLNMGKEIDLQIQKVQRMPNRNPNRATLRHIINH